MKKNLENGNNKEDLRTLASCLNLLAEDGYVTQFKAIKNGLKSLGTGKIYQKENVKIDSFYRFEGESDPSDNAILYAIETDTGEKGTLTDAYGLYSDPNVSAFVNEVHNIEKRAHKDVKS